MALHHETHPEPVDGCYGCKLVGLQVAPSAMPSRKGGAEAASVNAKEKEWHTDMDAYRSLRKNGLQPPQIDGAHRLQDAKDSFEVEAGAVFPTAAARKEARDGIVRLKELQSGAS